MCIFCNCVHNTVIPTNSLVCSKIFPPNDGYPVSTVIAENMDFKELPTFKS